MRTGLFGGTFNPIHNGHLKAAREVKKGFCLDKISLIPSALPPHKKPEGIADADARMTMIRLAVSGDPDFSISDIEQRRIGPSYTIDTVIHYKTLLPEDATLYLIVGLDAFLEMDTWKSYVDLLKLVPFIVMTRTVSGYSGLSSHQASNRASGRASMREILERYLKANLSEEYRFTPSPSCYVHPVNQPVFIFNFTPLDISSSDIRERVAKGDAINRLVPEKVADYIKAKGLYR
jgi:nicotinate-nucleotide adenylyltransferase